MLLAVLGERRVHLHDFVLFVGIVVGLAAAVAIVFVTTAAKEPSSGA